MKINLKKTIAFRHTYSFSTVCITGLRESILGTSETLWEEGEYARPSHGKGTISCMSEFPTLELGGFAFGSIGQFNPDEIRKSGLEVGYPFGATSLYGRLGTKAHEAVAKRISRLLGVTGGMVTNSIEAAAHLACMLNLSKGAAILRSPLTNDLIRDAFDTIYRDLFGISVPEVDFTDTTKLEDAIRRHNPKKLFLELPADLPMVYRMAIEYRIREIIVDASHIDPSQQSPIKLINGDPNGLLRVIYGGSIPLAAGLDPEVWGYTSLIDWNEFVRMFVFLKDMGLNLSVLNAAIAANAHDGTIHPLEVTSLTRQGIKEQETLAKHISALEGTPGGIVTNSGVSASHLAILFNLQRGDTLLRSSPLYDCTRGAFDETYPLLGIDIQIADFTDPIKLEEAIIRHKPRKLFLETPANPTMAMIDLRMVYDLAVKHGVDEVVVDNTFCGPGIQRPIEIVGGDPHKKIRIIGSGTKQLTGGLDPVVWGYTSLIDMSEKTAMLQFQEKMGLRMSALDAAGVNAHGIPTLMLRVKDQSANALKVARFLEEHPFVKKVNYPGLEPFKAMADRMFTGEGYGSVIYFELDDTQLDLSDSEAFGDIIGLQSFIKLAVSLGKISTLMENSWFMVHRYMSEEEKTRNGISPFGWRISVGSEDPDDIIYVVGKSLSLIRDREFRRRLPELKQVAGKPDF